MSEGTTKFQRFIQGTTAFWRRNKPRPGSTGVLVGALIGSASTSTEIIEKGINGEPMNMWYAVKFLFFFSLSGAQCWKLLNETPTKPNTLGIDPEGHLR